MSKHLPLILAFGLPTALILGLVLFAYLPSRLVSTDYNFLYATCNNRLHYSYTCMDSLAQKYEVRDGSLRENVVLVGERNSKNERTPLKSRVFLYDVRKDESREISLKETQSFTLNNLITSPDGVTISSDWQGGADFFPFFSTRSSYGYFLTKGDKKKKLNLINNNDRYYYRDNFYFIGWIVPQGQ